MTIEEILYKYLKDNEGVTFYFERPKSNEADSFVLIDKIGSSTRNHLTSSSFAFQSYAPTLLEAIELNEKVKKILAELEEKQEFSKIELDSDYNFTDPDEKRYRYQAVFEIHHY